jgi:TolB protein
MLRVCAAIFAAGLLAALRTASTESAPAPTTGTAAAGEMRAPIVITAERGNAEALRIGIPTFAVRAGAPLPQNNFHEIIYRDLEMTGLFDRARNQGFVEETAVRDRKTGTPDFNEWRRLDVQFHVDGAYEVSGNQLTVTVILNNVASGKRIFGKRFTNTLDQQRIIAHRVSDEILKFGTGLDGVANTKILYVTSNDPLNKVREIFLMDADGYGQRQVTNDRSLTGTPCWGANATEFYYTTYRDFNPDLSGAYLKGGAPWFVSRYPGLNTSPSWSPRRQRILLTLGKDGNSELYTITRDGKNPRRLTSTPGIESTASWSPDGNDVVFTSDRGGGSPQIYVMDAEGLNAHRISFVNSNWCDGGAWSPKGDKIAFAARVGNSFHIFMSEVNGSNAVQLTSGAGNNEDPSWAPNGELITFTSDRTGAPQVYVMTADGQRLTQLTTRDYNTAPAWSPYLFQKSE